MKKFFTELEIHRIKSHLGCGVYDSIMYKRGSGRTYTRKGAWLLLRSMEESGKIQLNGIRSMKDIEERGYADGMNTQAGDASPIWPAGTFKYHKPFRRY